MSTLIPMDFEGAAIRVVEENGEPLFVGKDVCDALGYANASDAMNTHCRGVAKRYPIVDSLGRSQETRCLTEPDVLRLIVNSKLPTAERFERWVFEEVLPQIRKTGSYVGKSSRPALRLVASEFRGGLSIAKTAGLKGNQAVLAAARAVERQTGTNPLAVIDSLHLIAQDNVRCYTPTELGERLGMSGQAFNKLLEAKGLQIRDVNKQWVLTPDGERFGVLMDTGKRHGNGTPIQQLKWLETVLDIVNPKAA